MIIAISGFGGSGKSTYAQKLSFRLGAPIIDIKTFCKSTKLNSYRYWDIMDYQRLEEEVLIPYSKGFKMITYGVFNWEKNKIVHQTTISFKDSIIVEGVGLFRPELLKYFDEKIWMDMTIEQSIKNGKERDEVDYGLNSNSLWYGVWKDNDLECFKKYKPLEISDKIITRNKNEMD